MIICRIDGRLGFERHANSELGPPPGDVIRQDAIQADRRQERRQHPESQRKGAHEQIKRQRTIHRSGQRLETSDSDVSVYGADHSATIGDDRGQWPERQSVRQ
jgi:hypothetical protein